MDIYIMPAVEGEFNLVWEDKPLNKEFSLAEKIKKQSYDNIVLSENYQLKKME